MDTLDATDNKQQQQQPVDVDFGLVDYESPAPISSVAEHDLIDYEVSDNEGDEDAAIEVKSTTEEREENVSIAVEEEEDKLPDVDIQADLPEADNVESTFPMIEDVHDDASVVVEEEEEMSPDDVDKQNTFPMVEEMETTLSSGLPVATVEEDTYQHEAHRSHQIPETWVHNGSSWMIYLGPDQNSFSDEYQTMLFEMPVTRLIDFLRSDISLRDDMEMSLEFPSLELTIDQRDEESSSVSLAQIYSGHAAAASLGKLSLDFINSSSPFYHSHSTTTEDFSSFCPDPETFAFIIHTRQSVKSTLDQIMKVVEENANSTANSVVEQQQQQPPPASEKVEEKKKKDGDDEVVGFDGKDKNTEEKADEDKESKNVPTSTAALLGNDHEDEEDDEDYVVEEEEEGDHVLDETATAEDEDDEDEEEVIEVGDVQTNNKESTNGEGDETRVESSANASPNGKNKRTKDETITATEQEEEEPVAKKIKESTTEEVEEPAVSTNAS